MERVRELLDSVSTLTLSTTSPEGEPHAAPVYFAHDEDINLYFFSEAKSQHAQDIAENPRAAVAIYPQCEGWRDIRGLQLRGRVDLVKSGDRWDLAWNLYKAKFPFVKNLEPIVVKNQLYVFSPNWIRLVDNSQGFGYKQEYRFDESAHQ